MNTVQPIAGKKSASPIAPAVTGDDRVISVREWSTIIGLSLSTARRLLCGGSGPPIVRLSERRIGVRLRDHRAWLDRQSAR